MQCYRKLWVALLLIAVFWMFTPTASAGELIYGAGAASMPAAYFVDPNTGQTTLANYGWGFSTGASNSPFGGSVFVDSGVNLLIVNIFTGQSQWLGALYHE